MSKNKNKKKIKIAIVIWLSLIIAMLTHQSDLNFTLPGGLSIWLTIHMLSAAVFLAIIFK